MISTTISILLLGASITDAVSCGRWYSNPCLAENDARYDPNASDNIIDQGAVWDHLQGFWKYEVNAYGPGGQPQEPSATNPNQPFLVGGFPYSYFPAVGFLNVTIVGTRLYQHRYLVFPPAPQEFCDETLASGFVNVLGKGTCGETGYSYFSELFGVSSYERDGTVVSLPVDFADTGGLLKNEMYTSRPINDQTIYTVAQDTSGGLLTETLVILDSSNAKLSSVSDFYVDLGHQMQLVAFFRAEYTRLEDKRAFTLSLEKAYKESVVRAADRVQNGQLPMTTACLAETCPSEENWCTIDPSCSTSRYQEPPGSMQGGAIAGFVIGVLVLLLGSLFLLHRVRVKQQENRYRTEFAKRVAETIQLSESYYALNETQLLDEFRRIDPGLMDGGEGKISKEAMKEFMQSGHVGYITESDFGALWVTIDTDHSGYVDFLEFCAFLAQCEHLLKDKDKDRESVARSIAERLAALSKHEVSARSRSITSGQMVAYDAIDRSPEHDSISLQSTLQTIRSSPPSVPRSAKSLGVGFFS